MDNPAAAPCVPAPATVTPIPPPLADAAAGKAEAVAGACHGTVAQRAVSPAVATEKAEDVAGGGGRRVFSVELRPGDTTIVSWRKLLKEAGLGAALPPPLPAAASQPVGGLLAGLSGAAHPTENDPNDPAQSNRFNAVIEKIERLYMGKHSSDEEDLDDVPDDDQYDTEDSFIDDAELDEYFEVDNLATKHNGYFVNKGRLEQIEFGSVETVAPKKRRRKDSSSSYIENNKELVPGSCSYMDSMPLEAPKRSSFQMGKNLSTYSSYHYEGNRTVKNKSNGPERIQKKNFSDPSTRAEHAAHPTISSRDVELSPQEIKEFDENKTAAPQAVDFAHKSRTNETYDYPYPAHWDKDAPFQDLPKNMRRKEKYGASQFSGLTTASNIYSTQPTHMVTNRRIEVSGTKKGTRLERAIRDLQNIVTEYKYQTLGVHEAEPNCQATVKKRWPQEVKQKLAKVARLSTNQGKIPEDELINRLMGIVGHLVQRRTLKRNMKEMVESGLYAKQEKADKLRQVKMEIYEMIKARLATKPKVIEQKNDSADNFEAVNNDERAFKGNSVMDAPLEDRICDLYDLYVEGMDEDKGPQSRKLYAELANLWPQGYMDKVGIRDAISRSKERRNLLHRQLKVRNEERMKRRLAAAAKMQNGNPAVLQSALAQQIMQPPMKKSVANYGQNQGSRNTDKVREMNVGAVSDSNLSSSDMKKRRLESDTVDRQANPPKAAHLQNGIEKQKPAKRADEAKICRIPQMVLAIPSYDNRPKYS